MKNVQNIFVGIETIEKVYIIVLTKLLPVEAYH